MGAGLSGVCRIEFPDLGCAELFAVAIDIESYPLFLPWCQSARVRRRDGNTLFVDNAFGAGPIEAHFETRAVATPPERLEITSQQAPFRSFRLDWRFAPLAGGGCRVSAEYRIEMRAALLHTLARLSLPEIERRVIARFRERVRHLHPVPRR